MKTEGTYASIEPPKKGYTVAMSQQNDRMKLLPLGVEDGIAIVLFFVSLILRRYMLFSVLLGMTSTYLAGSVLIHKFWSVRNRYKD